MSEKRVNFRVTPGAGIAGYWINVNGEDIDLDEGRASIDLPVGGNYIIWWMTGSQKSSIAIVGKDADGRTVFEVKKSEIPPTRNQGGGSLPFNV